MAFPNVRRHKLLTLVFTRSSGKGLLQPPPRPFTMLSTRAGGLPSSPARVNGLPSSPARRMPGQSKIASLRSSASSSALGQPPEQQPFLEQDSSLPTSKYIHLQEVQSPLAPVLSIQVQTPTVYTSNSRSQPSNDAPQPSRTLPPVAPGELLRSSRPSSPKTPGFDIIDAYAYMKRITSDQQQQQQQQQWQQVVSGALSPIYEPPPFTYTNALLTANDKEDGVQTPLPPLKVLSDPPQVEALRIPHPLPTTGRASPSVHSQEGMTTPAFSISAPSVPPVPPPIGPFIVGGANLPHQRYTPLSVPRGVLSNEFSSDTNIGLARTPRSGNFEVVMFGMGEHGVDRLGSSVPSVIRPSPVGVSKGTRVQQWQTFNVSDPTRGGVIGGKVHPPQGSVEVHEGRVALPDREGPSTDAITHDENDDEDDGGEFEMITAAGAAEFEPPGGLDMLSDREVNTAHTTVRVPLPPPLSPLSPFLSRHASSSSSNSGPSVGDDWYPSLPTDGVVGLRPNNQDKPRPPSLMFGLRGLDELARGEEKQSGKTRQLQGRRKQKEQPPDQRHRQSEEPENDGYASVPVPEPIRAPMPMRIPTPPPPFRPLALPLSMGVPLSDMLSESTAPAALQAQARVDYAPIASPGELSVSSLRLTSGGSDVFGFGEALSWERAPVKPLVEPVTLSDGSQDEFGRKDLKQHFATVQSTRGEPDSFSPDRPRSRTSPTPNSSEWSPTSMPLDKPLYQGVPRPLPRPRLPLSVFESPSLVPTDPMRNTILPSIGLLSETSISLDMLPILPPVLTSSPSPKHTLKASGNPKLPPAPPPPQYPAPLPPREAPLKDLHSGKDVPASTPPPLGPISDRSHPPIVPPPPPVPQEQVNYHPRSTSLPENRSSSPKYQSTKDGYAQPSPLNGPVMDKPMERSMRSYYENISLRKEKKRLTFAGVVRSLLKGKKDRKAKEAKLNFGSISEREPSRSASERGAKRGHAPAIPFPPPIGQAYVSPPPVPQQPPPAVTDASPQSLPTQVPTGASWVVRPTDGDGWVSRERVQATAAGGFATKDVRDSETQQDNINATQQLLPHFPAFPDTLSPHTPSSPLSVAIALPPLVYGSSAPITTHIASISTRLEAERDIAMSGGAPIPSLNTGTISYIISTLSHLNTRISEASAVLTQVIVSARVATGESGASSAGVDTQRMSAKVEKDMRTRLCEFLTESIFGRFSVALGSEDDRALRESHGDHFIRCGHSALFLRKA